MSSRRSYQVTASEWEVDQLAPWKPLGLVRHDQEFYIAFCLCCGRDLDGYHATKAAAKKALIRHHDGCDR